ncbi:uncharacterized protein LOC143659868 [Tamandua tetradactyla]|uniref:uncharacterized protein LOC143659868 n=1 Tax=Tamandua tetradactyla TaxID=48850 RepID=UPI004053CA80
MLASSPRASALAGHHPRGPGGRYPWCGGSGKWLQPPPRPGMGMVGSSTRQSLSPCLENFAVLCGGAWPLPATLGSSTAAGFGGSPHSSLRGPHQPHLWMPYPLWASRGIHASVSHLFCSTPPAPPPSATSAPLWSAWSSSWPGGGLAGVCPSHWEKGHLARLQRRSPKYGVCLGWDECAGARARAAGVRLRYGSSVSPCCADLVVPPEQSWGAGFWGAGKAPTLTSSRWGEWPWLGADLCDLGELICPSGQSPRPRCCPSVPLPTPLRLNHTSPSDVTSHPSQLSAEHGGRRQRQLHCLPERPPAGANQRRLV